MTEPIRKLAAIVFTDIVGFTKLTAKEQSKASALLKQQRELFRPIVDSYMGKWIKEIGDGLLLTFDTVTDAPPIEYESNVAFNTLPNHLQSQDDLRTCHSEYLDD